MEFGLNEILTIIDKVKSTDLEMFEYRDADTKIKIRGTKKAVRRGPGPGVPAAAQVCAADGYAEPGAPGAAIGAIAGAEVSGVPADGEEYMVVSPMVGTFYAAASEKEAPYVQVGDRVKKDQTVGIVEAMKLMNEIVSDWDGTVAEILVADGQMVEYGQPLVRIRP